MRRRVFSLITMVFLVLFACSSATRNQENVVSEISVFIKDYTSLPRPRNWKVAEVDLDQGLDCYVAHFENKNAMFYYTTKDGQFGDPSVFRIYAVNGLAMSLLEPKHGVRFSYCDAKLDYFQAIKHLESGVAVKVVY